MFLQICCCVSFADDEYESSCRTRSGMPFFRILQWYACHRLLSVGAKALRTYANLLIDRMHGVVPCYGCCSGSCLQAMAVNCSSSWHPCYNMRQHSSWTDCGRLCLQMMELQCLLPCSRSPGQPKQLGGGLKQAWHTRGSCRGMQTMTAKSARMPCRTPTMCWPKSCCGSVRAMAECTLRLPRPFPPSRPYPRSTESMPPYVWPLSLHAGRRLAITSPFHTWCLGKRGLWQCQCGVLEHWSFLRYRC